MDKTRLEIVLKWSLFAYLVWYAAGILFAMLYVFFQSKEIESTAYIISAIMITYCCFRAMREINVNRESVFSGSVITIFRMLIIYLTLICFSSGSPEFGIYESKAILFENNYDVRSSNEVKSRRSNLLNDFFDFLRKRKKAL